MRAAPIAMIAVTAVAIAAGCGDDKRAGFASDVPAFSNCDDGRDCDGDGFVAPADCNENDPRVNPAAYDFPGDGVDNDCDGAIDDPVLTCETIPTESPGSPTDFARAADLCAQKTFDPLIRAAWGRIRGYGPGQRLWISETKPAQVNIVTSFGQNRPRYGQTMAGFSTGPWGAADPRSSPPLDEADFKILDACKEIPLEGQDCASLTYGAPGGGGVSVQDWAELTLWLKVPSNAQALVMDFAFFSTEFNQFWNASLNDAFFVLVDGQNVAKDGNGLAMTVNSGFFQLCPPHPGPPGLSQDKAAALGPCVGVDGDAAQSVFGTLRGTGYDGAAVSSDFTVSSSNGQKYVYGGGSGWLTARAAVTPSQEVMVRIILHDTFDGLKDSAVLFDGFRWEPERTSSVGRPPR
ncbi:MAG: putative metal-binding motif-containing protein [Labilithrix sp.]|nr:putative metal-binding motif-containing protein [Labilithrix sp.]